ncbi:MAG: hypothetical protein WDA16_09215 [Candidatus Thermoplasmatota archaeon]
MRLAVTLFLMVLAGCTAPAQQAPAAPSASAALPFTSEPLVQDHDHTDRLLHDASLNLWMVSHVLPWGNGSAYGQGSVNEFAVNGNRIFVSRSNPEGGFAIIDASDAAHPRVVGDFHSEGGADIEVTSDGQYALLSTQRTTPGTQTLDNPLAREPRGIAVVDVTDVARPKLSSFFPLPTNGPHTASYHRTPDGREIVAVETYDLMTDPSNGALLGANPATQRVFIMQLMRDATGARLEPRGVYEVTETPPAGKLYFPHDAFMEEHPVTHKLLMYVAYWDAGVRIVDISDLTRPKEIAVFNDFAPSKLAQMHDVKTFPAPLGGRHVTAAAPEIVTAPESGQITFLDTTDPTKPTKLGHWHLPGNMTVDQPFVFSPHVFDTNAQGMVVIGHYHAGVWLIDAHDPANATTVGYYMPHEERPDCKCAQPNVWGARFWNGYVVVSDGPTGIYILRAADGLLPGAPVGRVG